MVSIRPLALIHAALQSEQGVDILVPADRDLHEYSIAISDISRLQSARLFFWQGSVNESFLAPVAGKLSHAGWINVSGDHPHAWLDRYEIPLLVDRMVEALGNVNSDRKDFIAMEGEKLKEEIESRFVYWQQQFIPVRSKPLLLGHEAFVSFAKQLGLQEVILYRDGNDHGHVQGGMKELMDIQRRISLGQIHCAMEEPDISFAALSKRYPGLKRKQLEPMAASIPVVASGFIDFIDASASAILTCLEKPE